MSGHLDEQYFNWLYGQVCSVKLKNPARTYWFLLRQFHRKEFVWITPNDDNRVEDGKELRHEFLEETYNVYEETWDPEWMTLGCSMLEMLIALSRRLSFEAEGEPRDWFWRLVDNIRLAEFNDRWYVNADRFEDVVDRALNEVIWRTYSPSGKRGLFPLRNPREDQREVELWYQASAYILENGGL